MVRSSHKSSGGPRKPLAIRLKEGTKVVVLLPRDGRWFAGSVKKYDTKKALHTIVNEIGDAKRVDLRTVQWKLDGIEECTEADIENALDRGGRWHRAQRIEFLDSMKCPQSSPREPSPKHARADDGDLSAWDASRLRARREQHQWCSSSDGDSGGNGEVMGMDEEDDFMDGAADSYSPPRLMHLSNEYQNGASKEEMDADEGLYYPSNGHLDFELSVPSQHSFKEDSAEDIVRMFGQKAMNQRGRKKVVCMKESSLLKRPVGRPPKVRKGLAAIKYAQDIAANAINTMANDKLCNFNVIPSSIPFVEELQLIFGISRRLKVEKQRMVGEDCTELAAEVLTGCRMAQEPLSERDSDAADASESPVSSQQPPELGGSNYHASVQADIASVTSPLKTPSCMVALRGDWSMGMQSRLVV